MEGRSRVDRVEVTMSVLLEDILLSVLGDELEAIKSEFGGLENRSSGSFRLKTGHRLL